MLATLLAHHVGIEIMGREYEPQGVLQHVIVFGASILLFGLAGIGFVVTFRRIAARIRGESYNSKRAE